MTTVLVTLTGDVTDAIGTDFDTRRTKAYVRHNTPTIVTDDGPIHLGGGTVNVNSDGTFELPNVVASTSLVENLQATVYVDYADPTTRQRATATFGPYDLSAETGTVDISDLETVQALDPSFASETMAAMQALLDQQELISGLTGEDEAVALLINTPASDTSAALTASYAAKADPQMTGQGLIQQLTGTTDTDVYQFQVQRRANYTGGTPGWVNSTLRVLTEALPGTDAYEWGITSVLYNEGTGQNSAGYLKGIREATGAGPTFGGVAEFLDSTGASDPTHSCIGLEVDVNVNGTDASNNRIGIDVFVDIDGTPGAAGEAYAGVRIGHLPTKGTWKNALLIWGTNTTGVKVDSAGVNGLLVSGASTGAAIEVSGTSNRGLRITGAASVAAIDVTGSQAIGLRLDGGTFSGAAIRLARGQYLAFENTASYRQYLDASLDVVQFQSGGTVRVGLGMTTPSLLISGTKVIGARKTGWTAATGTATRTAFDTTTVTLPQLAERVKALIDDLHATAGHGLIGA